MTTGKIYQSAQVLIAVILTVAALSIASSVFAPVAFALFIIALVWPLQKSLQAFLPKLLALAISVIVMVVAFFAFGSLIVWAFGRVGRWIVSDAARFQAFYDQVTIWLEGHGVAVAGAPANGSETVKVEPAPTSLSSEMRPPMRRTIRSLMLRPSPVPP